VLIHAAPKIVLHAMDPDEHLVQVPLVPGPWPSAAQAVGKAPARSSSTSRRLRLNT
jgi:hypothetical protein